MPEVMQEPFTLTNGDADVTAVNGGTSATVFYDAWVYHVPTGIGLILLPGHTFSLYDYDDSGAEASATVLVKVSVMDSSKQDRKTILGPVLYQSVKEFTDRDKMARLNLPAPVKVYEKQYVVVEVTGDGAQYAVVASSYFELAISRVRQPL